MVRMKPYDLPIMMLKAMPYGYHILIEAFLSCPCLQTLRKSFDISNMMSRKDCPLCCITIFFIFEMIFLFRHLKACIYTMPHTMLLYRQNNIRRLLTYPFNT